MQRIATEIIIVIVLFGFLRCNSKDNKQEVLPFEERVSEINKRLTYTELKPSRFLNVSSEEGDIYVITLRREYLRDSNTYYFNKYQYVIESGGDFSRIPEEEICVVVDSLQKSGKEKIKEIIKRMKISVEFSFFRLFKLKAEELQEIIAELYYSIASLGKDYPVDIYVKGYADGYKYGWTMPFTEIPRYRYNSIDYLPAMDTSSLNPFEYSSVAKQYNFDNKVYNNRDLPNLRAFFVKNDMIEPLIKRCSNKIRSVRILEGYEFSKDTIDPMERKVQIFIRHLKD
jgi:hypothetical protein